jgi:hypothetical protein
MYDLGEPDAKTELQGLSAIDSFNKIDLEHSAQFEVFFSALFLNVYRYLNVALPLFVSIANYLATITLF